MNLICRWLGHKIITFKVEAGETVFPCIRCGHDVRIPIDILKLPSCSESPTIETKVKK